MATLRRTPVEFGPINLNRVSDHVIDVDLGGARAASVSAIAVGGTWANKTVYVKKRVGTELVDIGAGKSIAPGGAAVFLSESEISGCQSLALVISGTTENAYLAVTVSFEAENDVFTTPNLREGPVSMPGLPEVNN
ncbi:MAG: hypothetical protein JSS51_10215 [Planctomycetes bacterium]|nr:hypothetical protein [Planctomycetota bacterium]